MGNDACKDPAPREAEERFGAIFDGSLDVILIVDGSDGRILRANESVRRVLGYEEGGLLGRLVSELQPGSPEESSGQLHENVRAHDATFQSMEFVRADGSICPMDVTATMVAWNKRQAILLTLRDVTERRRMEEELRIAATYDALTGLYNRGHLMEQLEAVTSGAKRHGFPLSLALCDVDNFKSVNDAYGHAAGDDVLAQFSRLVEEAIRTEDFAGRYGGDEFCVVFPHVAAADAAHSLERIRERFGGVNFQNGDGQTFSVTATFGIADLAPDGMDAKGFLAAADAALYEAKELGRNRVVVHDVHGT